MNYKRYKRGEKVKNPGAPEMAKVINGLVECYKETYKRIDIKKQNSIDKVAICKMF